LRRAVVLYQRQKRERFFLFREQISEFFWNHHALLKTGRKLAHEKYAKRLRLSAFVGVQLIFSRPQSLDVIGNNSLALATLALAGTQVPGRRKVAKN
jgi:hypothetical protein